MHGNDTRTAPATGKLRYGLKVNHASIGSDQRFCTEIILFHLTEMAAGQCQYNEACHGNAPQSLGWYCFQSEVHSNRFNNGVA